jgi:hypothetical protein
MIEVSDDITLWTARMTALACSITAVVYAAIELEPSSVVTLFLSSGPLLTVILWLQKDARRTGVGAVQDWGLFLWFAWPVVIPWYAWKTRGRAGWPLALGLVGLILSAYVTGAAVPWLIYGVKYAVWYFGTGG